MISKCCNANTHKQNGSIFCSHCIKLLGNKDIKQKRKYIYYFSVVLITLFFVANANAPVTENQHIVFHYLNEAKNKIVPDVALNDSAILAELLKDSCVLPSVAIAQAHIESAHYTSKKTFDNHNIFGIKPHKCKYVKGENRYQAVYDSYRDCIACYCHIQKFYLKKIDGHYAANKDYVNLIKVVK